MKLVIFDFDGVIVNTFDMAYGISSRMNPQMSEEEYRGFFRGNFYDNKLKEETHVKGVKINYFDEYSKEIENLTTEKIIKEQIINLSKKYSLAIVSSTTSQVIRAYLQKEGLLKYFVEIFGSDIDKNKVIKINRLLQQYNLKQENTVFITDTSGDIKEGGEAGIESIGVTWGYLPKTELKKEKPFAVIDSPSLLTEAIDKYFERSNLKA